MHRALVGLVLANIVAAPIQAAGWENQATDVRPGAFVGARVMLPLGGQAPARPRATLAIAPTLSRISDDGMIQTQIGEGLALNLQGKSKATLTVAGIRADEAFEDRMGEDNWSGVSTGGWIAIGVGTVLVAGAIGAALFVDAVNDNSE
jgi:hypothetical protein